MKAVLTYGHTYRARIAIDELLAGIVTSENLLAILRRYQLFGTATQTPSGFEVTAEYRGKTGTYELPQQVISVQTVR